MPSLSRRGSSSPASNSAIPGTAESSETSSRRRFLGDLAFVSAAATAIELGGGGPLTSAFAAVHDRLAATADEPGERGEAEIVAGLFRPDDLLVSLYGLPGAPGLGCLGEQGPIRSVLRVKKLAAKFDRYAPSGRAVPAFEVIASVASRTSGSDGNYSSKMVVETLQPVIDAATEGGVHLVFDLQPGRESFLEQARHFKHLWRLPNVSIALDPEWRVGPQQRPGGGQIGSVDADEINATIDYIDRLITRRKLPPKMCLIHQFRSTMITNQQAVRGTDQVSVVFQMDGIGTLSQKQAAWKQLVTDSPKGALTGWKNFYELDRPTPTVRQTMANTPAPTYVSFQ